jgi:hypothetical protein
MKTCLSALGKNALCSLLLIALGIAPPLSASGQEKKTIIVRKAAPAEATVEETEASDHQDSPEHKVIIRSIELPDGENAPRKDAAWLGVSLKEAGEELTAQLSLAPGVGLVATFVAPDSPAARAGLQKNDLLVEFQDQSLVLPAQLRKMVQARKEGDVVKIKFYRSGKPQTVSATLAKAPAGMLGSDAENGSSRELHLRFLGNPAGKELELQMESLRGLLGNLKIDSKQVQAEIHRSLDQARKSYRDALRHLGDSLSTNAASRQALEELAKSGVLLDHNATVTVRSTGKSARSIVKTDDSGTLVLVANPRLHLTAHDQDGKLLFDGEIETADQRTKVPAEVWQKVEPMLSKLGAKPEE